MLILREPTKEAVEANVRDHKYFRETASQSDIPTEEAAASWLQSFARGNIDTTLTYGICPSCGDFYRFGGKETKLASLKSYGNFVDITKTGLVIYRRHCQECVDRITGKSYEKNLSATD